MFFSNWQDIGRVLVLGVLSYSLLILVLRISGNRTLSKMSAFDLVVTVALGSTLATVLLNKNVTLAEGLTSFIVLIGLQYIVAWLSVRSKKFGEVVKSTPVLILYQGNFLKPAMRKSRVSENDVLQAVRQEGISSIEQVEAVVLENNGKFSVLQKSESGKHSVLSNVE